jgi:type IV pilus assembly protein PilW
VFQAARIDLLADGTDQIELVYGTSISSGMGARTLSPMASAMGQVIVDTGAGLVANQAVLLSYPAMALPCTVATVSSAVAGVGGRTTVQFNTAARFTPASWTTSLPNAPAYPDASSVSSLGDLVWRRYFVRNDTLIMLDVLTNTEVMIAEGVVRVRAQYGLAADATSTTVTTWQNAAGNAPLSAADQQRLRAIRLGVVSVNTQRERPASAGSCDTTLAAPVLWPGEAVDLSARTDWQCFRYRSYSTVVGLRNLQWGQSL